MGLGCSEFNEIFNISIASISSFTKKIYLFQLKKNPLLLKYSPFNITITASSIHSLGKGESKHPHPDDCLQPREKSFFSLCQVSRKKKEGKKQPLMHWNGGIGSYYGLIKVNPVVTKPLTQPT